MSAAAPVDAWKVGAECPQCGGAVGLEVGDPVLPCPYCRTHLYLAPGQPLRYRLQPSGSEPGQLFLPFRRVRGLRYRVLADPPSVQGSLFDATVAAWPGAPADASLGIRPQASRLLLVPPLPVSSPPVLPVSECLERAESRLAAVEAERSLFTRLIGETHSVVEAPFVWVGGAESRLREALPDGAAFDVDPSRRAEIGAWEAKEAAAGPIPFLALRCPECGHGLPASPGAVAFLCSRCAKAWQVDARGLAPLAASACGVPSAGSRLFPFWRLRFRADGLPFGTRAEMRKWAVSYQPVPQGWDAQAPQLLVPGFKAQPRVLLRAAKMVSLAGLPDPEPLTPGADAQAEPVRLPLAEAAQALKLVLASFVETYPRVFPTVADADAQVETGDLVFLNFGRRGAEWVQEHSGLALQTASVSRGQGI